MDWMRGRTLWGGTIPLLAATVWVPIAPAEGSGSPDTAGRAARKLPAPAATFASPPPAPHEVPADVIVRAFVKAEADALHLVVRVALTSKRDVDFPVRGPGYVDIEGATPLLADQATVWIAGYVTLVMRVPVVQAGADVNARTDKGQTPLHLALNSPAVAVRLLELGADPAARDDSGRVADPVSCENFGARSYFALAGRDLVAECIVTVTRQSGNAPRDVALHVAAGNACDPGVIQALMQAGAPLDGRDGQGYTPLHRAAETGTPAVIQTLLEAGADANRRVEVFRALNPWDPRDWTPLHLAAGNRDPGAVALILDAGSDVHARVDGYETPLHNAARNENPIVAQHLLRAGADVDAREEQGKTPLHVAALTNLNPAVLIEAGADVEARAMHNVGNVLRGLTPMYLAALGNPNPEVATGV